MWLILYGTNLCREFYLVSHVCDDVVSKISIDISEDRIAYVSHKEKPG